MSAAVGWQAMGKPDFATCAKLFYRFPAEMREGMNRSEERVMIWALFLSWYQTFHSGRTGALASFSETWLGKQFGRSRWTVLRALVRLEGLALLKRIRRSPKKDGTFQTNLIALSAKLLGLLGVQSTGKPRGKQSSTARLTSTSTTKTPQVPDFSPCSKTAPQEVKNVYKRDKAAPFKSPPLVPEQGEGNCLEKARELFAKWSHLIQ